MVGTWRIGRIMDDSLVRHPEQQVMLNVVIEEWPQSWIDSAFQAFAAGIRVLPPPTAPVANWRTRPAARSLLQLLQLQRDIQAVRLMTQAYANDLWNMRQVQSAAIRALTTNGGALGLVQQMIVEHQQFAALDAAGKLLFAPSATSKRVFTYAARSIQNPMDNTNTPDAPMQNLAYFLVTILQGGTPDFVDRTNQIADLRLPKERFQKFDNQSRRQIIAAGIDSCFEKRMSRRPSPMRPSVCAHMRPCMP